MGRNVAHVCQCSDVQSAIGPRFDACQTRQVVDVKETLGQRRAVLDEADQVGAARDERQMRILAVRCDCLRRG